MQYLLTEEEYQEYQELKNTSPSMVRPETSMEKESSFKHEVAKMFHFAEARVVESPHMRMSSKTLQMSVDIVHIDQNLQNFIAGHMKSFDPLTFKS